MTKWTVYIIKTKFDTLYTGITKDLERRFKEHSDQNNKTAKYLRGKAPLKLVCFKEVESKSEALILEAKIKKLPKKNKADFLINYK